MTWHPDPYRDSETNEERHERYWNEWEKQRTVDMVEAAAARDDQRQLQEQERATWEERQREQADQLKTRVVALLKEYGYWHPGGPGKTRDDLVKPGEWNDVMPSGAWGLQVYTWHDRCRIFGWPSGESGGVEWGPFDEEGSRRLIVALLEIWLQGWQQKWFERIGDIPDFFDQSKVKIKKPEASE